MKILAIETSCDETSAAIVENGTKIISNVVASSTLMHQKYGGIVPEVAARMQIESIIPVLTEAVYSSNPDISRDEKSTNDSSRFANALSNNKTMKQYNNVTIRNIDAIAIANGPGLIGSLLIGVETAKTLSLTLNKPIIPVNHVIAHMYANFIRHQSSAISHQAENKIHQNTDDRRPKTNILFPAISLVVSGGHTELYLMESEKKIKWLGGTMDDAAGEAFDKGAIIIGLGSGGGLAIQNSATKFAVLSSQFAEKLPRPMIHDHSLNFSFSGLKTALMREVKKQKVISEQLLSAFAYELQEAICDCLVAKTINAAKIHQAKSILISGGVSANLRLREKFKSAISNQLSAVSFFSPPISLCTDNAAYIASCAYFNYHPIPWQDIQAIPDLNVEI